MQRGPGCFRVRKTGSAKQSSIYSFPSGKMNGPPPCTLRAWLRCLLPKTKETKAFGAILKWFLADVIGSLSLNVVSFSRNVVPDHSIFSVNVVPKPPM
jgi:hypothetical protein